MRRFGMRELRQNPGPILRAVTHGETVEITNHGHPVARIIPVTNDNWASLIASHEVIPARTTPTDILTRPPRTYANPPQPATAP